MKKWMLKAVIQKAISFLPKPHRVNFLFQKYVTKGVQMNSEEFVHKISHARDHINYFEKHGSKPITGSSYLELGSGWYPIVPICLFLKGAEKLISLDIRPWITRKTINTAFEWIINEEAMVRDYLGLIDEDRFNALKSLVGSNPSLEMCLKTINLELRIGDARNLDISDASVNYISSNNTLEHIYPDILSEILNEFWRVLRFGGVMSHHVDMSDHFANMDESINEYNFLQYNEKTWALIDNTIQPQNRLRLNSYVNLFEQSNIPITEKSIYSGKPELVANMSIDPMFKSLSNEEIAITQAYLVSAKLF